MSFKLKCLTGETLHSGAGATATTATTATESMPDRQPVAKVATVAVAAEPKRENHEHRSASAPERFSVTDDADFERIGTALRAELARRPAVAGIASYRPVLDPQTRKPITAIVSARRQAADTITVSEIAGTWDDPRVVDLETWAPPGEPS